MFVKGIRTCSSSSSRKQEHIYDARDGIYAAISSGGAHLKQIGFSVASNIAKGRPLICEGRAPNNATLDAR